MKKLLVSLASAMVLAAPFEPAGAHHSAAMFDPDKTVTVQGTIKEFIYTNPHSWLLIIAAGPNGAPVQWSFESEGPSTLRRWGIKYSTLKPGDKISVTAHPLRDGRLGGVMVSVTRADGSVFAAGQPFKAPDPTATRR